MFLIFLCIDNGATGGPLEGNRGHTPRTVTSLEGLLRVKGESVYRLGKRLSKRKVYIIVNRALYMLNTCNVNGKRARRERKREKNERTKGC